jgi:MFS transporter, MHS family, citrate/tricarballylate:H+ symporter
MQGEDRPIRGLSLRQIGAVAAGNTLEVYDFLTFAFFAAQIGRTFFPARGENSSLLLALATFGVGFLFRPLGGVVIGRLGDAHGRKPAMLRAFLLMGVSIVGMALTPSYASIGIAAPLLVVGFRLVQGFALGGESGPATAFLLEAAPPLRRGLFVSLQLATQQIATLMAGLVGLLLATLMPPEALGAWGWRIAFLLGAAVVPVGLFVRNRLPETFAGHGKTPIALPSRAQVRLGLVGLAIISGGTIATYTLIYLATYAGYTLGFSPRIAFGATVTTGLCGVIFNPLGGWLSDRIGRKPVVMTGGALLMLAAVPCFFAISTLRTPLSLYLGSALMGSLLGTFSPGLVLVSEILPREVRSGGFGIVYALAVSVFGGSAQFIVTWLIGVTGSALAPAWYMAGFLLVSLIALAAMPETAPAKCGQDG